jgi:hypothetical protein
VEAGSPPAAPAAWTVPDAVALVGGLVAALRGPTVALVGATLLRPLQLGPDVAAAWAVTRDVGAALLGVALLFGILRAQVGPLVGLDGPPPWRLLPRLLLAAVGVAGSLPLARGLLAFNNVLCAALLRAAPGGGEGLVRPLAGGLVVSTVPAALGIGPDLAALVVLAGLGALACSYLIRAAEVVLLTLLLPLAAALWVVPGAEPACRALLAELVVSVFVQTVQTLVLLVFSAGMGGRPPGGGGDWLWAIAALALLFRCRALLAGAVRAVAAWAPTPGQALAPLPAAAAASARVAARVWGYADRLRDTVGP